jgi:3-hydroxyacyl-CoA dehydrogenase
VFPFFARRHRNFVARHLLPLGAGLVLLCSLAASAAAHEPLRAEVETFIGEMVRKHGFDAHWTPDLETARQQILSIITRHTTFGFGGSDTVRRLGIVEHLKLSGKTVFDHWQKDLTPDESLSLRRSQLTCDCFFCSANAISLSGEIVNVDGAMRRGFAWRQGPFESWDSIGVKKSVDKMKKAGYAIPAWVEEMLGSGKETFYKRELGVTYYYDIPARDYRPVPVKPGIILLPSLKDREKKVAGNKGASLVDIGDGVACLEFHTKMNALGDDIINMIYKSADIVSRDFLGLVIANHGDNFSAGANLPLVLFTAQEEEWDEMEWMVKTAQDSFMRLKYLDKPVVAAPAGMALGGGCEICLASDRVRYAAETYMGLVEAGVGLIPAIGGTKEMLIRNTEHLFEVQPGGVYPKQIELVPFVARAFETIALAKVATSGPEAVKFGFLRPTDKMTVNRDYLIEDAKKTVLAMHMEGYTPPEPLQEIRVAGENTYALIKMAIWTLNKQGYALAHDMVVAEKVAYVLCGGRVHADTRVSEQYLLDLEREAFVSLCGYPQTQARIQHMLTTGKPLRN